MYETPHALASESKKTWFKLATVRVMENVGAIQYPLNPAALTVDPPIHTFPPFVGNAWIVTFLQTTLEDDNGTGVPALATMTAPELFPKVEFPVVVKEKEDIIAPLESYIATGMTVFNPRVWRSIFFVSSVSLPMITLFVSDIFL